MLTRRGVSGKCSPSEKGRKDFSQRFRGRPLMTREDRAGAFAHGHDRRSFPRGMRQEPPTATRSACSPSRLQRTRDGARCPASSPYGTFTIPGGAQVPFPGGQDGGRFGLRPIDAHHQVDRAIRRGEPVALRLRAGAVLGKMDLQRAVRVLFQVGQPAGRGVRWFCFRIATRPLPTPMAGHLTSAPPSPGGSSR